MRHPAQATAPLNQSSSELEQPVQRVAGYFFVRQDVTDEVD
jgi:hypothetical protein